MNETPEEKAARKARETAITDAWLDYRMGKVGRHFDSEEAIEKLIRADERAKLAASVLPMTMSALALSSLRKAIGGYAALGNHGEVADQAFHAAASDLDKAVDEIDALCAALAATRDFYAVDEAEQERLRAVISLERQRLDAAKKLCDELSLERRALKLRLGDEL